MIGTGLRVQGELCGGPLDGQRVEVSLKDQPFDMYLFDHQVGRRRFRLGYQWANATVRGGKLWRLDFHTTVSDQVITGTGNTGEEAEER
jgi:hypothetical protein